MLDRVKGLLNDRVDEGDFWLPRPKRFDFMTLAIMIPVIASAIGLFLMAIETFIFVQFASLSQSYPGLRSGIALVSSFFMAFGGEVGSIANNTEIFSKQIKSKLNATRYEWDRVGAWDWTGFGVSWLSTSLSVLVASSTRDIGSTSWQSLVSEWLILPLMLLAVGDVVFGTIELGFRFGTFDARMLNWLSLRKQEQDNINYMQQLHVDPLPEIDNAVRCWCGELLTERSNYDRHVTYTHQPEVLEYDTPVAARNALRERYADTLDDSDIQFPELTEIIKWREQ